MKTLYIDTNILGCEEDWKQITALGRSMPTFRVIVSDWHMVELTGGADRIQAARRACFIDSLRPLWMRGYLQLQMCEIERFVWQHYYGRPCEEPWIFTEHLSAVWADYLGSETVIGLNAKKWAVINRNLEIRAEKIKILEALNTLQTASQKQKRQIESEVFPRWTLARISDVDPDKKTITECQKMEIARFCYDNRVDLYADSPAIAVESELHKIRSRDAARRPRESDAVDLFHGVLALSYCDYYITRDGFARQCANYAKHALRSLRTGDIYESLDGAFPTGEKPEAGAEDT